MDHRAQQHPQKAPSSGISSAEAVQLRARVEQLEKHVATLLEAIDEKNLASPSLRKMIGKRVSIVTLACRKLTGNLTWVDRYSLGLSDVEIEEVPMPVSDGQMKIVLGNARLSEMIMYKGALETITTI